MGRKPRILVAGAVYHVYNRISSGEKVFASAEVAEKFLELVAELKERDGWTVFAWCGILASTPIPAMGRSCGR